MGGQGQEERRADRSGGWGVAGSSGLDFDGPTQIKEGQKSNKDTKRTPKKWLGRRLHLNAAAPPSLSPPHC